MESAALVLAIAAAAVTTVAGAQTRTAPLASATPATFTVPRAYAGYSQPDVSGSLCRTVSPLRRECTIPALTAGRYMIEAAAAATATSATATQSLEITVGGQACIKTNPAKYTGTANLHLICEITVLTDQPLIAAADYTVQGGTPESGGPQMVLRRLPWTGVLSARGGVVHAAPAAGAPAQK